MQQIPQKRGGTVRELFQNMAREQFENSSRVGHGEEEEGNQFEFAFAGSFFFKGAGGSSSVRIRFRIAKKRHSSRADEEGLDGEIRKKGCKRGGSSSSNSVRVHLEIQRFYCLLESARGRGRGSSSVQVYSVFTVPCELEDPLASSGTWQRWRVERPAKSV